MAICNLGQRSYLFRIVYVGMCFSHGGELDQIALMPMIKTFMELKFRVGNFKGTYASIAKKVIEKIKGTKRERERERDERKYQHSKYYSYVQ